MEPSNLRNLGWDPYWQAYFDVACFDIADVSNIVPGRIISINRGSVEVQCAMNQQYIVKLSHPKNCDDHDSWPPVVGDWVVYHKAGYIVALLPRRSYLARPTHNRAIMSQPIAANIDFIFAVEPMKPTPSPGRVERLISIGHSSGIPVVLITTKSDLVSAEDTIAFNNQFTDFVMAALAVTSENPASYTQICQLLGSGKTAVLLGRSGAGKTTITNALMGLTQRTGSVRESDSKGRHTTTTRELFIGESGIIIDTPGIRELAGVEDSEAVLETFSDIADIAQSCRFQDCTHGSEPDCAVKQALEDGSLDVDRFKRFCRMRDEAIRRSQDLRTSRANQRAQSKNNTQGRRAAMKQKGRSN